jgi:hypothetical protein
MRFEEWRSVVNHQRGLIAAACRSGTHVTEGTDGNSADD